MVGVLLNLAYSHSPGFIAGAICICAVTAWLLLILMERAAFQTGFRRLRWMAAVAAVAGLGVWTTHFIAVLGFRPDILFGFNALDTLLSALIGITAIGFPIAGSVLTSRRSIRAALGALGGLGVSAMHFSGMAALQGCVIAHSVGTYLVAGSLGSFFLAAALAIGPARNRALAGSLILCAVCTTHFSAVSGLTLTAVADAGLARIDRATLGLIVAGAALSLFLTAFLCAVSSAKLDEQRRQSKLLSLALNNMSNGLLLIDAKCRISLTNERFLSLFGIDESHVRSGMGLHDLLSILGLRLDWDARFVKRAIGGDRAWVDSDATTHLEHISASGKIVSVTCRPIGSGGAVFTFDDVTGERQAKEQLRHMAYHDALTGLANRRAFQKELSELVLLPRDISLLMIDLDRFKSINDTLGHAVGDGLLVQVARRLRAVCGPDDFIARFGGDEIAILRASADAPSDGDLVERLMAIVDQPFFISGHTVRIGCSVGIATTDDIRQPDVLVQYADLALFVAKTKGRGQCQHYETGMLETAAARRQLEADLVDALRQDQLASSISRSTAFATNRSSVSKR